MQFLRPHNPPEGAQGEGGTCTEYKSPKGDVPLIWVAKVALCYINSSFLMQHLINVVLSIKKNPKLEPKLQKC